MDVKPNILFFQSDGHDYLTSQITEGLSLLARAGKIGLMMLYPNSYADAQVHDIGVESAEWMLSFIEMSDILLFSSGGNMMCFPPDVEKILRDPRFAHKRVFLDGHDGSGVLIDPAQQLAYFKREMRYPEMNLYRWFNMRSLSFGVYQHLIDDLDSVDYDAEWEKRDIDVSFMAFGGSNPARPMVAKDLSKAGNEMNIFVSVDTECQPVEKAEYRERMRRSKIGISVSGAGYDTLRFWEIPGYGAVLMALDISTKLFIRNGFEAGRNCVCFQNMSTLIERCRNIVSEKKLWITLRKSADQCVKTHHSTTHRAMEMLEMINELV